MLALNVEAKIVENISLYNEPKYPDGFSNFEYVNPNASKGGRIVMPAYGGFDNFNPYIFKGIAAADAVGLTIDSLGVTSVDDQSSLYPLIAQKFDVPDDKSYIGFIIDERAKFADGTPILADDVIFSFESLINKGMPLYKVYYGDVEKVEKINPREVRFIFKKNTHNRELPLILGQLPVFSKAYFKDKDFSAPELVPMLANGPYVMDRFEQGKYMILKRNKNYWAKDLPSRKGMFNFDEIRFDYYQDTTITKQALFAGNIDIREEYIAKNWVSGYDNDLIKKGKIKKENIAHNKTANLQNFGFNLRRDKFADKKVRQAIAKAFDFEWANDKLFYSQYERLYSYFTNSGMEALGKPKGLEKKLLDKYQIKIDEVFENPKHNTIEESRQNLREAVALLKEAGYDFVDGKMTNLKTKQPLEFEVLSNSANGSSFTRVMLPFINNLKKIGIKANFRNVEVNIFKNRLDNFDFDIAILAFGVSSQPGNEQKEMWGSESANIKGSYNLLGIQNEKVDALIKEVIQAKTKDEYEASVKALDRVLLNEHYMIMQWYSPHQRIAYWDKFLHPKTNIKTGFQPHTWWMKK